MYRIGILLTLAAAFSFGCNGATPTANRTTFRVDVKNDPSNSKDFCETLVSFHPPSESKIIVRTASSESVVSFDSKNPNSDEPTVVRLSVDRTNSNDGAKTEFTTLLRPQTPNGGYAGGPSTQIVDGDISASDFLTITVDDGNFSVNEPIELGTLNGEPIELIVQTE